MNFSHERLEAYLKTRLERTVEISALQQRPSTAAQPERHASPFTIA